MVRSASVVSHGRFPTKICFPACSGASEKDLARANRVKAVDLAKATEVDGCKALTRDLNILKQ